MGVILNRRRTKYLAKGIFRPPPFLEREVRLDRLSHREDNEDTTVCYTCLVYFSFSFDHRIFEYIIM